METHLILFKDGKSLQNFFEEDSRNLAKQKGEVDAVSHEITMPTRKYMYRVYQPTVELEGLKLKTIAIDERLSVDLETMKRLSMHLADKKSFYITGFRV